MSSSSRLGLVNQFMIRRLMVWLVCQPVWASNNLTNMYLRPSVIKTWAKCKSSIHVSTILYLHHVKVYPSSAFFVVISQTVMCFSAWTWVLWSPCAPAAPQPSPAPSSQRQHRHQQRQWLWGEWGSCRKTLNTFNYANPKCTKLFGRPQ